MEIMLSSGKLSLLLLLIALSAAPSEAIVPVCVDPPSGLVSWWKGEDNADDSAGTNHGTIMNSVGFVDGMVGKAFSLDGNSYVEAPDEGLPLGSAERTIVAWVYPTAYNGLKHIVHYGSRGSGASWGLVILGNGTLIAHEWLNYEGAGNVPLDQWSHVAISLSNGGVKKHYINGTLVGESTYEPNTVSSGILRIGARIDDPYNPPELFHGLVDEVAVFNRALTADEIAAIYNAGIAGMCPIQQDNVVVLQPGPGSNDGSDDGSASKERMQA
jgi:hypothetical protein